ESAALDRLALNSAETAAKRGHIARARLQYTDAAQRYAEAAAMFPSNSSDKDKRIDYIGLEALALCDSGKLREIIKKQLPKKNLYQVSLISTCAPSRAFRLTRCATADR